MTINFVHTKCFVLNLKEASSRGISFEKQVWNWKQEINKTWKTMKIVLLFQPLYMQQIYSSLTTSCKNKLQAFECFGIFVIFSFCQNTYIQI